MEASVVTTTSTLLDKPVAVCACMEVKKTIKKDENKKLNFFIRIDFKQKYIAYSQFLVELVRNLLLKGSIKAT